MKPQTALSHRYLVKFSTCLVGSIAHRVNSAIASQSAPSPREARAGKGQGRWGLQSCNDIFKLPLSLALSPLLGRGERGLRSATLALRAFAIGIGLFCSSPSFADDLTPRPTMGEILRLDPAADSLLPADAKIEVLASGMDWSEGPVWIPKADTQPGGGGYLIFSDVPRNEVMKWKEGDGLSVLLKPSGYTGLGEYSPEPGSNGLNLNSKGELISCEHGDRRISVLTRGGGKRTLADNFEGKRFSSPNDSTIDKAGNIYFTDPPYGLPKGPQDTEMREIPWNGIYKLSPDGKVTLMSKEMTFPNGITLSPDQKTLYVSQSDPKAAVWVAFPIQDDGTLGAKRVIADATSMVPDHRGLPDGMKTDTAGHIWSTGPGGVHVMTPEGKLLARIDTKMACGNCCFGDDGSWLYICSDAFVVRVKTKVKGNGF